MHATFLAGYDRNEERTPEWHYVIIPCNTVLFSHLICINCPFRYQNLSRAGTMDKSW